MTNEEALKHWLKTYKRHWTPRKARRSYAEAKLKGFNSYAIDYAVANYPHPGNDRKKLQEEYEKELAQDIIDTIRWSDVDSWRLDFHSVITNQAELNDAKNTVDKYHEWGECMPDHAKDEGLCSENPNWDVDKFRPGTIDLTNPYYLFGKPFIIRVFYRKDSDYEVGMVFTDPTDTKVLAISQRED